MPGSSRSKRLVHRIRLKPMKKKIVGGSTCRICTSHQSKARWGNDTGAETETLGWLTPYLPKYRAESPARLCATFKHACALGVRGDRVEAAGSPYRNGRSQTFDMYVSKGT